MDVLFDELNHTLTSDGFQFEFSNLNQEQKNELRSAINTIFKFEALLTKKGIEASLHSMKKAKQYELFTQEDKHLLNNTIAFQDLHPKDFLKLSIKALWSAWYFQPKMHDSFIERKMKFFIKGILSIPYATNYSDIYQLANNAIDYVVCIHPAILSKETNITHDPNAGLFTIITLKKNYNKLFSLDGTEVLNSIENMQIDSKAGNE